MIGFLAGRGTTWRRRPGRLRRHRTAAVLSALAVPLTVAGAVAGTAAPAVAVTAYKVTATIPLGNFPHGVAVDPATGTIYTANPNSGAANPSGNVSVIDGATGEVTGTISVGITPSKVAVDPATDTVYTANADHGTVSVIDGATGEVTGTINVGGGEPYGVAVDPVTDTVYTADYETNTVSVIDGATGEVTGTITIGDNPYGVAVDPSTDTVYVANYGSGTVSVINGHTNAVTATVTVGKEPYGVAVDPATDTVYTANNEDITAHTVDGGTGTVSVIDGRTNTVTGTITIGADTVPDAVAVDPATDTVYVTNRESDTVSVIDGATSSVTATVPVGSIPKGVAVDPGTHAVYVANSNSGTVSVITPASATVPGAPVIGKATVSVGDATVTFTPPSSDGGLPITGYTVEATDHTDSANGGQTATGAASPITVTGLTNGDSYTFTVTATNEAGTGPASAPSNAVTPKVPGVTGAITGYDGKCVDDYRSGTANGTKVDIDSCSGLAVQQWTLTSSGELVNTKSGKCLNDAGYGGRGTKLIQWTCSTSYSNEIWTYDSAARQYVLQYNGLCLNDPGYSRTDGTQLVIWACGNYSNERWSSPGGAAPSAPTGAIKGYLGKCLDDYRSGTANGTKVDINTCNGSAAQKWTLTSSGELRNAASGKCLNDAGYGGRGTGLILWTCIGSSNEIWASDAWGQNGPEGQFMLKYPSMCLTDPNYSTTNGTQAIISACAITADDYWTLPGSAGPSSLTGEISGYANKCVDGSGTANGSKVDISACDGTPARVWTLTSSGLLRNAASGKCLNDAGYGGQGTKLIQWTCSTSYSNEIWSYDSQGQYKLGHNGLCLNDPGYSRTDGTQLIIWKCGDYANEQWSLALPQ